MPTITLHQWPHSPFCGKARAILRFKGLDVYIEDYFGFQIPRAKKLVPSGKVPVMDYDGERIADSTSIAHFLEERHPSPPLLPADSERRALVHLLEDWADEALFWFVVHLRVAEPDAMRSIADGLAAGSSGWIRWMVAKNLAKKYAGQLNAQGLGRLDDAHVRREFLSHAAHVHALLDNSGWLVGDSQTLADIAVAAQFEVITRHHSIREELLAFANIEPWLERTASTREAEPYTEGLA